MAASRQARAASKRLVMLSSCEAGSDGPRKSLPDTRLVARGLGSIGPRKHRGRSSRSLRRPSRLLRLVRAQLLDALEITGFDPGDVFAAEAGTVEACGRGISVRPPRLRGRPGPGRSASRSPAGPRSLSRCGRARPVPRSTACRCRRCSDSAPAAPPRPGRPCLRTGIARHLHDLLAGGAAHDRIVDQQHHAVAEFQRDRVELALHRLRALALPGMMKVRPT
jgi:hypothetical protein